MNGVFLRRFVGWAPDPPLETSRTEQLEPVDKRIMAAGVELDEGSFTEIFEFYFAVDELSHILVESFGASSDLVGKRVKSGGGPSEGGRAASGNPVK